MTHAIIIGSGIGGLASAIRLARQGICVEVFEASETAGGKVSERNFDGFRFDAGPSLLTLPELTFELLDNDLHFSIRKLEIITNYFYPDGTQISAYSDIQRLSAEVEEKLNVPAAKVTRYLQKAAKVYELTSDLFIFGSFHRIKNLMNLKSLKTLFNFRRLQAFSSLHEFNTLELREKRLVQLFDRYATYNGSDPYQTPATLSVISHLEHNTGAFIPEDGMFQLTESLVKQALRLGVKFHFGQPVRKVETDKGNVRGVWLDSGFIPSDIVISDVDIHHFYSSLLPDSKRLAKINKEERSSSALIFYWGMKRKFPELDIHNIFFSEAYQEEFRHLFEVKDVYNDPTVYIYISCKYKATDAPEGYENWFVMINAPADTGQNWDKMIQQSRQHIIEKLERMLGKNLEKNITSEEILSPPEIGKQTGSVNGSIYGNSSNSRYASFNRHANFRSDIRGLYFVGGSVHPGGGIPLCLSSARIVDGLVKEQLLKQVK
ncbi:MAG TPA: 1-hydroxycarotenoid 3,4-desaturase CrtD [Prolixibacteraceae bacterium]|nr:1-hydroxycarotenoid 3,4-desaturase CrtD [Prolixibacteraceae bacterium]